MMSNPEVTGRFNVTNNEAEYESLIAGLRIARQMGVQNLQANVDSKLVANQRRRQKSRRAKQNSIYQFRPPKQASIVEELKKKSIDEKEVLAVVEEVRHTWMTPVYEYLIEGILPKEKRKERAIRRKAGRQTTF
ncbi:reverse transcriptase domain-containing protein [Tanacetum coccineum]